MHSANIGTTSVSPATFRDLLGALQGHSAASSLQVPLADSRSSTRAYRSTTDTGARLKHLHRHTLANQVRGRAQAADATADDDGLAVEGASHTSASVVGAATWPMAQKFEPNFHCEYSVVLPVAIDAAFQRLATADHVERVVRLSSLVTEFRLLTNVPGGWRCCSPLHNTVLNASGRMGGLLALVAQLSRHQTA